MAAGVALLAAAAATWSESLYLQSQSIDLLRTPSIATAMERLEASTARLKTIYRVELAFSAALAALSMLARPRWLGVVALVLVGFAAILFTTTLV